MIKRNIFLLLLSFVCSAQAISFRDYYHGNAELGIPSHEKDIVEAVRLGSLNLNNKDLTDLIGFNEIPGLNLLRTLFLNKNQFSILPENIFDGLTSLQELYLSNNQLNMLPENIFRRLTALKILVLYKNQLIMLSENIFHGLISLQALNLENNQLIALPGNIFSDLPALRLLYLGDNPIPLSQAQLRKELRLPANVLLEFKTQKQERAEQELFRSIENADVSTLRKRLEAIKRRNILGPKMHTIDISKIRDSHGDNLLHAAIRDAAKRIGIVNAMTIGLPEKEKAAAKEVQAEQKAKINQKYMKIISVILSCGEKCVQEMLFTPNAEGEQVIDAIIAKLGLDSPIYTAIIDALTQAKEEEKKEKEQETQAKHEL